MLQTRISQVNLVEVNRLAHSIMFAQSTSAIHITWPFDRRALRHDVINLGILLCELLREVNHLSVKMVNLLIDGLLKKLNKFRDGVSLHSQTESHFFN